MGIETPIAAAVFRYFSPAKSPFYLVTASGGVAIIQSCNERLPSLTWYLVATPIFCILLFAVLMAFGNRSPFQDEEADEQLRFARGFGISCALLCFVKTALSIDQYEAQTLFWISYSVSLAQAVVFLLYTWARSKSKETGDFNFVQLALMTSIFLISATFCVVELGDLIRDKESSLELQLRYEIIMTGFYLLWAICLIYWLRHLGTLIRVTIPDPTFPTNKGQTVSSER